MTKTSNAYNEALQSAREQVERAREHLRDMKANRRKLNRVGKMLETAIGDALNSGSRFFYSGSNSIYCHLDALESFKDARLIAIVEALESIKTKDGRTTDWPDSLNRDFRYYVDDIFVMVSAYVRDDSPTCRKVLVGTEIVQQEKWEIRCD